MRLFMLSANKLRLARACTAGVTRCGISSTVPVDNTVKKISDPLSSSGSTIGTKATISSSTSGGVRLSRGIEASPGTPHALTDALPSTNVSTGRHTNTSMTNTGSAGIHCDKSDDDAAVILDALERIRVALRQCQMPTKPNTNTNTTDCDPSSSVGGGPLSRDEVLLSIVALMEKDTELGPRLLAALSGDALRVLLVVCTAQEYFGQDDVETQLRAVDKNRDDNISSKEYDDWVDSAVRQRAATRVIWPRKSNNTINNNGRGVMGGDSQTSTGNAPLATPTGKPTISWGLWRRIACSTAVPFMAFGLIDNAIFVTVGNTIDQRVAHIFGISSMTAAALGGVVSGTAGIQVHGFADRMTQRSQLARAPQLLTAERQSPTCNRARRFGSVLGMLLGLVLGMTPLLWLSPSASLR